MLQTDLHFMSNNNRMLGMEKICDYQERCYNWKVVQDIANVKPGTHWRES